MKPFQLLAMGCLSVAFSANLSSAQDGAKKSSETSLNDVGMEVNALQAIYQFRFTTSQMEKLQQWAKQTASPERKREPAKASKEYGEKLRELRTALADGNDSDLIDQINEDLDELREAEEPQLDDGADITDAARKKAPEALQMLKATQLAAYITAVAEGIPDPLDRLVESFDQVRELKGSAWREKRDEVAEEVSRLVMGLDPEKADPVHDQVSALLIRVRSLSSADYAKQRDDLETAARKVIGDVSPAQVLRHYVENDLATLLSNPRLPAALAARMK